MKVSALILTHNNEQEIRECLESILWADEIVIIDSNSTDNTLTICKEFTDKIHNVPFTTFGDLRNKAVSFASHDWIFSLDTDERVTPETRSELEKLIVNGPQAQAYYIPRRNFVLGRWVTHGGWYPDYRQPQFFHRSAVVYDSQDDVHEGYQINGKKAYFKHPILQYPFRDVKHFLSKMDRYSTLGAIKMKKKNRRFHFLQLFTHPLYSFFKTYILRKGMCDGLPGFILAILYAYYTFIKYVKFWELSQKN